MLRDRLPDPDTVRLRLMDRHPLYRVDDDADRHTYRHRLTGREVVYDEHRNRFDDTGYLGAVASRLPGTDAPDPLEAEWHVLHADDVHQDTLDDRLADSDLRAAPGHMRRYRGDGYQVHIDHAALADDEIAVAVTGDCTDMPAADIVRDLDHVGIMLRRRHADDEWIRFDTDHDPYRHLNDTYRWQDDDARTAQRE